MIRFCTLFSSSSGNSVFLSNGQTSILIDAGVSAAKITNALETIGVSPKDIDAIFVTHEHSDHTSGINVLVRKFGISLYANSATLSKMETALKGVEPSLIHPITTGESVAVGSVSVRSFKIPHDAAEPVGYTVTLDGKKYGIATDTGCITKPMLSALAHCEAVVIESNHDENMLLSGAYPYILKKRILSDNGHLSNENCAWLATQLALWGTKRIVLGHISENNNTVEKAYLVSENKLLENNFEIGKDVYLTVAEKNQITEII